MDAVFELREKRPGTRGGRAALAVAVVTATFALGAVGCGGTSEDGEDAGRVHFNPLERDGRAVREVEPPDPPVSVADNDRVERIISGFRENAQEVFRRDDPNRPLGEIERLFESTGKYLQLVAIYQEVVEKQGFESEAAPRLAWALVRLGQERQARDVLDRLIDEQSDEAFVHFVDGSYWFNKVRESREAGARAAVAWRRVLELDPGFQGPRGIGARGLRQNIRQIEKRLPESPEQMLAAAETERGNEPGASGETAAGGDSAEESDGGEATAGESDEGSRATEDADASATPSRDAGGATSAGGSDTSGAPDAGQAEDPVPVLVTRADLALGRGDLAEARRLYRNILEGRDSDHLGATFGWIRVRFQESGASTELVDQLGALRDRSDLTAELAYEMGLFARAKLDDDDLAEAFWDRVRDLDPAYAESVGIAN